MAHLFGLYSRTAFQGIHVEKFDLIVIGGGPAGIFGAGFAARQGRRVLLLEKNARCGAKLLITGKGRCNVTHAENDPRRFVEVFGRQGRALLTALYSFGVEDVVAFFSDRGLALKRERGGRIFPSSADALAVQQVLDDFLREAGVTVKTGCTVEQIHRQQQRISTLKTSCGDYAATNYLIATGGKSYPETGSTGDGYRWAAELGHRIVALRPVLVPLLLDLDWTAEVRNFNLKNVRIRALQGEKLIAERFGEAFFTRSGISGPIILDMSAEVAEALEGGPVRLQLDLKPALDEQTFDRRLQRELTEHQNRNFSKSLDGLLPKALIPVFLRLSGIDPAKKCHSVSREERGVLLRLFKALELPVKRAGGFRKAIVSAGGVDLRDIDMRRMRSRIIENLYFAGELIDLDGPTGGFNLQLCWSTGYLAGISAAERG